MHLLAKTNGILAFQHLKLSELACIGMQTPMEFLLSNI